MVEVTLATTLDTRQKTELRRLGNAPISISILTTAGEAHTLSKTLVRDSTPFVFIDTVLTRQPAGRVFDIASDGRVLEIEFVDDGLARRVLLMLGRLQQLHLYIRTGMHEPGSLNISLAPPRHLINGRPSRTAERTVRRAIEVFTMNLGLPVIMPIGNDGPEPGSANPWALAEGVILATAADEGGTQIWPQASRFGRGDDDHFLVAAWGVDGITERDTRYKSDLPPEPALVEKFGKERAATLRYVTGTSFASSHVAKSLCHLHQAEAFLRKMLSSVSSLQFGLTPHIRGILDSAIDREAPQFHLRQVECGQKYDGLEARVSSEHKNRITRAISASGIDLDLRLRPQVAQRFLRFIAKPMPQEDSVLGFVNEQAAQDYVAGMRVSDLINLYADTDEPRKAAWKTALARVEDPQLLPSEFSSSLYDYCENYDLILALPLAEKE